MLLFLFGPIMYWIFKDNAKKWELAKGGDTITHQHWGGSSDAVFHEQLHRSSWCEALARETPVTCFAKGCLSCFTLKSLWPQARSLTWLLFPPLRCRPAYGSRPAVWQLHMCQERGDLQPIALPPLQQDQRHLLQGQSQVLHPLTELGAITEGTQEPRGIFVTIVLIKGFCEADILETRLSLVSPFGRD